ncbi:MAG: DUF4111 domain-containing protein [Gammaproteobacteria bacterium]|nr:DUF4111 domain-containing protein [Gammaproteobacteria bacterium]MCW5583799.1 DUF4111 domain-containing protein [Gammaproteobacteria bacterium]
MTIQNVINNLFRHLLLQIQLILSDQFVGMYVGGSIANNSFNEETSDIDCYIVTTTSLPKSIIHKIEEMHKQFYASKLIYAKKVEASYIPQHDLLYFNPDSVRPYFNEGSFYLASYGSNFIIELYMLRERGSTIAGPDIKKLIKEISLADLKLAIQKNLDEYWNPVLNDLEKLKRSDYQVFAILTMCRTLYSMETGMMASKKEAAQWVIKNIDTNWKDLIEKSLSWKPHHGFNRLKETQQFVEYVIEKYHVNKA